MTTDAGQVIAAVTPPVVETPVTPVTPDANTYFSASTLGQVSTLLRWWTVTTLGDQVSSQYAQLIAATTANAYTIERLNGASAIVARAA